MENHTAKHFVLQLGSLASLYLSVAFFIVLIFGFINLKFPDAIEDVWSIEQAASNIRLGFAMVIVFFPTYLILTRQVNKNRRLSNDTSYLTLTKWLIYLSLLVGGAVLLGDLVAIILGFLGGELTTRFILKASAVFIVTGMAFYYYLLDAKSYWITHEKQSVTYALVATGIIIGALIASLTSIQTPSEVREYKIDQQMVGDLQDMQWRIEDYVLANDVLPENLQALYGEFSVPTAPEGRDNYSYKITGETTYKLCATFLRDSNQITASRVSDKIAIAPGFPGNYNWDYKAGYWCFERVIDDEYRQ